MPNAPGPTKTVEYWSPYGNHVSCWLEKVSIRLINSPLANASDPDWFVSVDGNTPTKVQSVYYKMTDDSPWDAKVHSHLQTTGGIYGITFDFEHIGSWNHPDGIWRFLHWDGSAWEASIQPIGSYNSGTGDVQPTFNLKKLS